MHSIIKVLQKAQEREAVRAVNYSAKKTLIPPRKTHVFNPTRHAKERVARIKQDQEQE